MNNANTEQKIAYWKELHDEVLKLLGAEIQEGKKLKARITELEKENELLLESISDATEQWDSLWAEYEQVCKRKAKECDEDIEDIIRTPEFFSTQKIRH